MRMPKWARNSKEDDSLQKRVRGREGAADDDELEADTGAD